MKLLRFADSKRAILTFEAGDVELARDADSFLLQAQGSITHQDTPALEELMHGNHTCLFSVTDGDAELMNGRYHVTFLTLEPDQLVVRISVGEA